MLDFNVRSELLIEELDRRKTLAEKKTTRTTSLTIKKRTTTTTRLNLRKLTSNIRNEPNPCSCGRGGGIHARGGKGGTMREGVWSWACD